MLSHQAESGILLNFIPRRMGEPQEHNINICFNENVCYFESLNSPKALTLKAQKLDIKHLMFSLSLGRLAHYRFNSNCLNCHTNA